MKFKEIREKYKGKFPSSLVAAAVKIALDMSGAMTPAVKKIEAMKRGLSNDPAVKNALRLANESIEEKLSPADKKKRLAMIKKAVEKLNAKADAQAKKDALAAIKAFESANLEEDVDLNEEKFKLVDMDDKTAMNAMKFAKKAGLKAVVKKTNTGSDVMVVGDNKKMAKFLMSLPNESVEEGTEEIKEFKTSMPFFSLRNAEKAEKLAQNLGILKNSEAKGKLYTVHVDGSYAKIEKWLKLI